VAKRLATLEEFSEDFSILVSLVEDAELRLKVEDLVTDQVSEVENIGMKQMQLLGKQRKNSITIILQGCESKLLMSRQLFLTFTQNLMRQIAFIKPT
jgi:hypothetical protein